jgi:hypothetical protein
VASEIPWGRKFAVHTSADVGEVVLMAPGATTHAADMQQRRVPLRITERVSGQGVNAVSPDGAALAPPGWYMLFVIDRDGVPSVARWVHLDASAPSPAIFDTRPPRPRLELRRTSVKKLARGAPIVIRLKAGEGITGKLSVRLRVKPRAGRAFSTPLGFRSGQLLADGERGRRLVFTLSRAQRREMRRARRVTVRASVKARDGANNRGAARLRRALR